MSPAQLINDLGRRGADFLVRDGRLVINAPRGILTPQDSAALRAHKLAIRALIAGSPTPDPGPPADPGPRPPRPTSPLRGRPVRPNWAGGLCPCASGGAGVRPRWRTGG